MQLKNNNAVITGARGMDASHLADLLLSNGYKVIAIERRSSSPKYDNIKHLLNNPNYILESGDITDFGSISRVVKDYQPSLFFNLAAQSFVGSSWSEPIATINIDFVGVANCLEAIRLLSPDTRFLQASSSETVGGFDNYGQNELTPHCPKSPYAAAKCGSELLVNVYRDSYNLFACYSRAYNHTGPRRGKQFVERKITDYVGYLYNQIKKISIEGNNYQKAIFLIQNNIVPQLKLGNIKTFRDFTHSADVVRGMYMMMLADKPNDYVLASGHTHSVEEILRMAFKFINIKDLDGIVSIDSALFRPAEVKFLHGDYSKIKKELGWEPTIPMDKIIEEMVKTDIMNYQ